MKEAREGHGRIHGPRWLLSAVAMAAVFMATVDMAIVVVALPWIRGSVGATLEETSWFVSAYLVANLCMIPISGHAQRRFGYRRVLCGSVAVFLGASVLCAQAWSTLSMVLGRLVQGLGGGLMMPTADALLLERFPHRERSLAIALTTIGRVCGPLLGPALGGLLVDRWGWPILFWINVPIGLLILGGVLVAVREDRSAVEPPPTDGRTLFLLFAWLLPLQLVLEEGQRLEWWRSPFILGAAGVALLSFVVWLVRTLQLEEPPVRLRLLADGRFAASVVLSGLVGINLFAGLFLFNLYCGERLGFAAHQTGLVLAQAAFWQALAALGVGRLVRGMSPFPLMLAGALSMTLSVFEYSRLTGAEGTWDLLAPQILRAVGMVLLVAPNRTLAFERIAPEDIGDANALLNVSFELGGSLAISAGAAWLVHRLAVHRASLEAMASSLRPPVEGYLVAQATHSTHGLELLDRVLGDQALAAAFGDVFRVLMVASAVMALVVLWLARASRRSSSVERVHRARSFLLPPLDRPARNR